MQEVAWRFGGGWSPCGGPGVHRASIGFLFPAGRGPADNFLNVYPRAEIGYDTPEQVPERVHPGKLARRLIFALITGVLAGVAIMLQIKGWTTLGSEAGGACGTSVAGVSAATGAQRWTLASPNNCSFQQLAASAGRVVALAACDGSYDVVSIDPTAGQAAWQYHVTEPSDSYQFQILSASPVVINDDLTGPRGTSTVREFGPNGAETLTFNVSGIPLGGGTVALNTGSTGGFGVPVAVTDGMLVGVTNPGSSGTDAVVGYRLADGRRQWLVDTPDEVNDAALSGSELVFVDESDPAYSLEEVNASTGTLRSLGYFTQGILQSGQSGLYPFPADDVVVNTTGDSGDQPPVAAIKAPAAQG